MNSKKIIGAFIFALALPLFVSAQGSEPANQTLTPAQFKALSPAQQKKIFQSIPRFGPNADQSQVTASTTGAVSCFNYYRFGSVQVNMNTTLPQSVPGATLTFEGNIKNNNPFPIVNGSVYVKIFRKGGDASLARANGRNIVDQFALDKTYTLPALGEKQTYFSWKIPGNTPAGEYTAAFFFQTDKRYNLLGLSFTNNVTGGTADFSITSSSKEGVAYLDNSSITLNGDTYGSAAFVPFFKKNEPVLVKVKLVNPKSESVVVPVTWDLYSWDSLRKENLKSTKTILVALKAHETKTVSYTANPIQDSISYLVVKAKDHNAKSILDIRFTREGIKDTRINFPGITSYPLVSGKENTLFSCVQSINAPVVKGKTLTLTLNDDSGNLIHTYTYTGDITANILGVKSTFVPKKTYTNFSLTATLSGSGGVYEKVTQSYSCADIDPNLCQSSTNTTLIGIIISSIALLLLLGAGFFFWKKRETKAVSDTSDTPETQ